MLILEAITKKFPGVTALDNVDMTVRPASIHALVGENGAGKSTLMKILSGIYPTGTYRGRILLDGEPQDFRNKRDSERAGISIVYQELAMVGELTVCENVLLGNEISRGGRILWNDSYVRTHQALELVGLGNVSPTAKTKKLGVGQQQLVEIARALNRNSRVLVLDEPTASLSETETAHLGQVMKRLRDDGVSCIFISHRLEEVFDFADTVTVLRDGRVVGHGSVDEMTKWDLVRMMVGRELREMYPRQERTAGGVALSVRKWSVPNPVMPGRNVVDNVNLEVRYGELLGIAGLIGSGRTELVMSIIGAYGPSRSGEMEIDTKPVRLSSPVDAIRNGVCCLTENRKDDGLVLGMSVMANITLASLLRLSSHGILDLNLETSEAGRFAKDVRLKYATLDQAVRNLSGGNQQKVVLSKWLMTQPKILLLDEPTRGVDVGAKVEIYKIMNEMIANGVAVVMVSSELEEIVQLCDRVVVMAEGCITGELKDGDINQEQIMHLAVRGRNENE